MKTSALILAAGRGTRAGYGLPKTYRLLGGTPILRHSIFAFLQHSQIDSVQVVIHPDDEKLYNEACEGLDLPAPVYGGNTRAESVVNGLSALSCDNVLIHDGARPFVSSDVIARVVHALQDHDGAIPAIPATDAMWKTDGQTLIAPAPREGIIRAQTPQGFRFEPYIKAAKNNLNARDDAELALNAGMDVIWVEGDIKNTKLTYPEDFE